MAIKKRYFVAGAIGLVTVAGALGYLQYKKIMNYSLAFKGMKNVKLTKDSLSFNIYYDYTNKADIDLTLQEQEYDIYVNDVFVTRLSNYAPNILVGGKTSEIGIAVNLDLKDISKKLGTDIYVKALTDPKNVIIKTEMKWKVKLLGFIKIPVKYPYIVSLKEILGWYFPKIK